TGDTLILQLRKQQLRCLVVRRDVSARESEGNSHARESVPQQRVASKNREAGAVLRVILNVLRVDADGLSGGQRRLLRLVELIFVRENRESRRDRPVKQIRLRETAHQASLQVAELRGKRQRFAQAEEIVGLICQADESAIQSADTALQANGLFAFFFQLQQQVDSAVLGVALDFRGFVCFELGEVIQLIQAQDAQLPRTLVEQLSFVDQQLAANNLVARGGVAGEV